MQKRVADIVVETLIKNGIDTCFSVVGGGSMHLNNAFAENESIKKIYNHHEQASAMAAAAYGKATGKLAVTCVTSGPGGTNTINGVQGAWVDSSPMLVLSGHPRMDTTIDETGLDIRCRGVQENDIISQVKGITKYAKLVTDPYSAKAEVEKAIQIALDGRRGPVWLAFPLDVQGNHIEVEKLVEFEKDIMQESNVMEQVQELYQLLRSAKRPCILTGSGIRTGNCIELFGEFIRKIRIPIVGGCYNSDICYKDQSLFYGMTGMCGTRAGNMILQNADCILVLGNSLSFYQTGHNQEGFAPKAKLVMVDVQKDESKKPGLHVDMSICTDLKTFFEIGESVLTELDASQGWVAYCNEVKTTFPGFEMLIRAGELDKKERVPSLYWWKQMLRESKEDAVFALGNSTCTGGILQEGIVHKNQRVLVNPNCGSMGYDLPNAIGTSVGLNQEVICVTGDGSIMMNLQELQTIRYNQLPIKVVVFSNDGYGAIRNTCKNHFSGVNMGCDFESGISFPEFELVANTFGFPYRCCNNVGEVDDAINWLNTQPGYCMLEVKQLTPDIGGPGLVSIMKQDGSFETPALHQMTPLLTDEEMDKWMISEKE